MSWNIFSTYTTSDSFHSFHIVICLYCVFPNTCFSSVFNMFLVAVDCNNLRLWANSTFFVLQPLPQLSVMNLANDKAEEMKRVALAPGPCVDVSLCRKNSTTGRHTSPDNKYHYMSVSVWLFIQKKILHTILEKRIQSFCVHVLCSVAPYSGFNKQHSFLYKRTALPLTDQEKSIFTFQT